MDANDLKNYQRMIAAEPQTIDITPNVDGLIRWLRQMHRENPAAAVNIFIAGWPSIAENDRRAVLAGEMDLAEAIRLNGLNWREEYQPQDAAEDFADNPHAPKGVAQPADYDHDGTEDYNALARREEPK